MVIPSLNQQKQLDCGSVEDVPSLLGKIFFSSEHTGRQSQKVKPVTVTSLPIVDLDLRSLDPWPSTELALQPRAQLNIYISRTVIWRKFCRFGFATQGDKATFIARIVWPQQLLESRSTLQTTPCDNNPPFRLNHSSLSTKKAFQITGEAFLKTSPVSFPASSS